MSSTKVDALQVSIGHWPMILASAGIDAKYLRKKHGPCPICRQGTDRYRFIDKNGTGSYYCSKCGPGSGVDLLIKGTNLGDFKEACNFIRKTLHYDYDSVGSLPVTPLAPIPQIHSDELTPQEIEKRRARYKSIWEESRVVDLASDTDPVSLYLKHRVNDIKACPKVIRSHPSVSYFELDDQNNFKLVGKFTCMISVFQGPDGRVCQIHKTYLSPEGKKAKVEKAKKFEKSIKVVGGACRLYEPDTHLAVAEGIETALNAYQIFGVPTWSVGSTYGMKTFEIPQGYERIKKVTIYADNDGLKQDGSRPGLEAAQILQARLKDLGIKVILVMPARSNTDFAELPT